MEGEENFKERERKLAPPQSASPAGAALERPDHDSLQNIGTIGEQGHRRLSLTVLFSVFLMVLNFTLKLVRKTFG